MTRVTAGAFVRPIAGEVVAGDACLVEPWARGVVVVAADGLGHGPAAATASNAFLECVRAGLDMPLPDLFSTAHRALLRTRGAVVVVARFDEAAGKVEIAGIGNVTALLAAGASEPKHIVIPAGVVGGTFRTIRPQTFPFLPGDLLLLHTDGVHSRFACGSLRSLAPAAMARAVVTDHGKASDDAGCVVAVGSRPIPSAPPSDPGGSESVKVAIRAAGDAECCAVEARAFAGHLGFPVKRQWEVGIAVSELATNVLKFAPEGTLTMTHARDARERMVVEVVDRGNGITDVGMAAADGFSEGAFLSPDRPRRAGQGLGVGLGCVHRMMDHVTVETSGAGTRVVAWKYRA